MVAEARPTPPSLTSISPSSSALTLQPIDPPPNLSSPLPTIPVHPNHHDLYPCYHHPTHPHHDHLLYSTTAPPKSTGVIKGGTSPIPATTTCSSQTCHHLQTQRPRPTPPSARAIPSHPIPSHPIPSHPWTKNIELQSPSHRLQTVTAPPNQQG